jgi:hypothetical protein
MSLADELWRKYERDDWAGEERFKAALREYGEAVRAGAVKECDLERESHVLSLYVRHSNWSTARQVATDCAAAISKMELP